MTNKQLAVALSGLVLALGLVSAVWAGNAVAVLNFELYDLTLQPNSPAAQAFTASVAPALRAALAHDGLSLARIPAAAQNKANAGFGYLYQHDDVAARLGRTHSARYVVVGRVHKPTDLFQYLKVHLIDAASGKRLDAYEIELKGQQGPLLASAVKRLAAEIKSTIASNSH